MLPILALLILTPLSAREPSDIHVIETTEDHYSRHPRLEEEDLLRNRSFTWAPGLEIVADVDDAEVRLDGEKVGRTPWESDAVSPGAHRVALSRVGYAEVEFRIVLGSDRRTTVEIRLRPDDGTLVLENLPEGARVRVDGEILEGPTIDLPAGRRSLEVSTFGWETRSATVEIQSSRETRWRYDGSPAPFELDALRVRPRRLSADDPRGFRLEWTATAPGSAEIVISDAEGRDIDRIPVDVDAAECRADWAPESRRGLQGGYGVRIDGLGDDGRIDSAESSLVVDDRVARTPRIGAASRPGLFYAPGTAVLPPGSWQVSTGAGAALAPADGAAGRAFPFTVGLRVSPATRWEIDARFGVTVREPFESTGIALSLSGAWRATPGTGPFSANIQLGFDTVGTSGDFGAIPADRPDPYRPGPILALPMEIALGRWNLVMTPVGGLAVLGSDPGNPRFAGPVRPYGAAAAGVYYEGRQLLLGHSSIVQSPVAELPGWTLWTAVEGRWILPGDASFLSAFAGLRVLDGEPMLRTGLEFGLIG